MARFEVSDGLDDLISSMKKVGNITEEESMTILDRGGEVLVDKFRAKIGKLFQRRTGKLKKSIRAVHKSDRGVPHVLVAPSGAHHKYRDRRSGRAKTTTANDVGFVLEYGSPARGIQATHWMEESMAEGEDEVVDAMQEGFDEICERRGL